MTALPGPPTSSTTAPPQAKAQDPKKPKKRPEAVQYLLVLWLVTGAGEVLHQILQMAMSLTNRSVIVSELKTTLKDRGETANYPDSIYDMAAYLYIFGTGLVMLVVVGVLLYMLGKLAEPATSAGTARRLWFAFSLYFGLRVVFVFMTSPGGSDVPTWLMVTDGILQILIGCAAGMGIAFSLKEETVDYTGELAQVRELEKQLREKEKQKEKDAKK